jgi:outer membrane protein TolC
MMTSLLRLGFLAAVCLAAVPAPAGGDDAAAATVRLFADPTLARLVDESLTNRPELEQADARVAAARDQAASAAALPDPMLTLGLQNDGFAGLQVGKMETSYFSIMAQQTFPWPGKRGLRRGIQGEDARQGEAERARVKLQITADVRRAYVDLLLVREQLTLQGDLETLWREAAGQATARYETGAGVQADVLRAQLETTRLKQRRWALEAEERRQVEILNRFRNAPLASPVTTATRLASLEVPALPDVAQAVTQAETQSPELSRARAAITAARGAASLAKKDYLPDYTLSAALMPRGGDFPTMWQLGVGVTLPLWAAQKQGREVSAANARAYGEERGAEAVRQILRQRVAERITLLSSLIDSWRLYRGGLLVQSSATAESTLAQYRVGNVTFAAVLEALAGYVNDANGYYETVASAERLLIAMDEVSLDSPGASAVMGAPAMPAAAPAAASGRGRRGAPGM